MSYTRWPDITLACHEVVTRKPHECADCHGEYDPGTPMLRCVGLENLHGGFIAFYVCPLCPWPNPREFRKPNWRRKIPGKHGPKTAAGRTRCYNARMGLDPWTGVR